MKRRTVLSVLALWAPAALAAVGRDPHPVLPGCIWENDENKKKKVEYHGVALVNRVEPILGLVNVTHGAVPFAGWNTYTRDLRVKPRELVRGLAPGMKIRFRLTAVDPLTYVITALEPLK